MLVRDAAAGRGEGRPAAWRRGLSAALIVLAAAVACVPVVRHMPYCGDDVQFHLLSWFDAQQSWRTDVAYPHLALSANFGAGEPRFVFYPPLTWMLGGALGLMLPWVWVPVAMMFVLLAGTGLATRVLARRMLPEAAATMAGVAAVVGVYPLFTAYDRAGFGELAGGIFVPLVLLFAMDGAVMPLALAVAGCWLSDAPAGVMAMYLLVGVAAAIAAWQREWKPLLRRLAGGALGVGLAAFYLLPAAYEQRWVNIREAAGEGDPGLRVEKNFLFGHSVSPVMPGHDAGLHYVSWLVIWMVVVSLICAAVVLWQRRAETTEQRRMWWLLAALPIAVLVMQLPVSLPLWDLLPKLRFLQFPWRWLLVLEAPTAVFLAGALWPARAVSRWIRVARVSVLVGVMAGSLLYVSATGFKNVCNAQELPPRLTDDLGAGHGSWGADEYATVGAEDLLIASGLPDACIVDDPMKALGTGAGPDLNPAWSAQDGSCVAIASARERRPDRLRWVFASPQSGWAVLRLRSYPAWRVRVNSVEMKSLPLRKDGLITVPVPQGQVEIAADWRTTHDAIAGWCVSTVCVLITMVVWGWKRRRKGAEA